MERMRMQDIIDEYVNSYENLILNLFGVFNGLYELIKFMGVD